MFSKIEDALNDIRHGRIVVVVDDEDRENEGDLIMASEWVSPDAINFMAKFGRGLICVSLPESRLDSLRLPPMIEGNTSLMGTPFRVSVDAKWGTSTGISAEDRAITVRMLINPNATPADFAIPGHIFPLAAREGGVLRRAGHTEAAIDLARLAGLTPSGVLCEIMSDDGKMARLPELKKFCKKHKLNLITVKDLIHYRFKTERLVHKILTSNLPTKYGIFKLHLYESKLTEEHHIALTMGEFSYDKPILTRVHSQCLTGDVFGSLRCDCGDQLQRAMKMIKKEGSGVIVYMRQEGRGIGLPNKLKAYVLQDQGQDTVEANLSLGFKPDLRDYGEGAQILADLGIKKIRLITNNPKKIVGLEAYGLEVVSREPIVIEANEVNRKYLEAKRSKLGHLLPENDKKEEK
ncbi:MAG: bifunctional 3,4-dihydroxy-2-butanone-4-phosphate synthase/GTP cyclohydrolase II [Candidatus Coatesbacteria bacterium]|nr:bifunctional 3,4-dihydroxy-2-butanone-4-phosphate synthase/GTP cyclohydrolase II [Candidatus Coatesbacteria bacterium]